MSYEYINETFKRLAGNNINIFEHIFLPTIIYSYNENQEHSFEDFLKNLNMHDLERIYPTGMHIYNLLIQQSNIDKELIQKFTHSDLVLLGDIHANNLTKYSDGNFVYHKSDNTGANLLQKILDELSLDSCIIPNDELLNDDYHKREFLQVKNDTSDINDVISYFYNLGRTVPILLALTTYDLIYSNIIVNNARPVFFDLDCIFYPRVKKEFGEYTYSITSGRLFRTNYSKQLSGVRGGLNPIPKALEPVIQFDDNTPYLVWGVLQQSKQENLIKLNNIAQDIQNYIEVFLQGYDESVNDIKKNKTKILDIILKYNGSSRYVLRSTHRYKSILSAYHMPPIYQTRKLDEYLKEQLTKKHVMHIPNLNLDTLINDELKKLEQGIIPYYKGYINTTDIVNEFGEKVAELSTTPFENLINHFNSFDDDYFDVQKEMLKKSLNDSFIQYN